MKRAKPDLNGALPECDHYNQSIAHPQTISHVVSLQNGFFATASIDGFVHFSKYSDCKYESQKIFKVHSAPLTGLTWGGTRFLVSVSLDKTCKIFDTFSLEIVKLVKLTFVPECAFIIDEPSLSAHPFVVASARDSPGLYLFRLNSEQFTKIDYQEQVIQISYNRSLKRLLVACESGALVYIDTSSLLESSLVKELLRVRLDAKAGILSFSPDYEYVAFVTQDRIVRVLQASSLKSFRKFDESLSFYEKAIQSGKLKMNSDRFDKALELESELERTPYFALQNISFDSDSRVILIPTMLGIKAIDLLENKSIMVYGREDDIRPIASCLLHVNSPLLSVEMASSDNPRAKFEAHSMLITSSFRQPRFFIYNNDHPDMKCRDRDLSLFPTFSDNTLPADDQGENYKPGHKAVIRTTLGDITIELYPSLTPRTVENFCTLARKNYYDNFLFHRVIKGFIIQTGCPRGDGTGGECIWGGTFANELCAELKHDRPFTVSMANSGSASSNGSQFFITTIRAPWLDRKHTVFGRVMSGEDIIRQIESVETDRLDRPKQDVRMLTVEITE
jgi:peptidylprolyl isomerase domain and WD repeat-containing protein 1